MKYLKAYILIIILFPSLLNAQIEIYDLKRCLEIGLENNYEIRIVANEQRISDNNKTLGNAGYLPTMDLSSAYSGTVNNTIQKSFFNETTKNNGINNQSLDAGINLGWTIFDGMNIQANYSRLKELQKMGELNTRMSIEDFIANLSTEYYNYVRQKIRLSNLKAAVELSKERVRIVEERYNIGSMSRLDLQQARVDFNADSSNLIKQFETLHISRISINEMMAFNDIEHPLNVIDSVIVFDDLLNKEDTWKNTLNSNVSLLLSEKNKSISQIDLKAIRSRNYPYLKINAGYGYSQSRYETGNYKSQEIAGPNYGATIGFTIFDGFNRQREQKNAKIRIQNKEIEHQQLELSIKADFSNFWMAYQNNMELTLLEKENLQTAKENYTIAIERYKLGDLSGIELREAQNSLLEAEERLLQAQYVTKLCEISLLQISGKLTLYLNIPT